MLKKSLLFILIVLSACTSTTVRYKGQIKPGKWLNKVTVDYEHNNKKYSVPLKIFFPKNYQKGKLYRTIILLHSYNKNNYEWAKNSNIERYASQYNCILVAPSMKTSVYASQYYPESSKTWGPIPGSKWIIDYLVPYLQDNFALCATREKTAIMGVETGARGALLCGQLSPGTFKTVIGLSGYYKIELLKKKKELINVYGEFKDFKNRWQNEDNPIKLSEKLDSSSVFLYHGGKDQKISSKQTLLLAIKLNSVKRKSSSMQVKYARKKSWLHDWPYWNRMIPDAFSFIDKNLEK